MGAYLRGALIKKFQLKGGCLFERGGNSRVGTNLSIYGTLIYKTCKTTKYWQYEEGHIIVIIL